MDDKALLISKIEKSNLSQGDRNDLLSAVRAADADVARGILVLVKEDETWLSKLNSNLQVKKAVLAVGDIKTWQKIVDEEQDELARLLQNER